MTESRKGFLALSPRFLWLAPLLLVMLLAGACATHPMTKRSGFLQDYDRLKQDPQDPSVMFWERPGVDWKRYKRLMLDPVEVRIDPTKAERELTRQEMKKLADTLRQITIDTLKQSYPVVDKPAPDVLRVRAAITDLVPVMPVANITSVVLVGLPMDLGRAGIEVRFSDSLTGRLLAEMTDVKIGSPITLDMGWTRWGQIEDAFEDWAEELKDALDEVHGKKK